jgi:hemoglobin/transferrin/lactoferrin receptor protein
MKKVYSAAIALFFCHIILAQNPVRDTVALDEVVVVAGRLGEKRVTVPVQTTTISNQQIRFWNSPTSADLLQQTGKVFVQKSQLGGGSPVLRGFEANRVLMVIDGVRMNNAIYRSGHLQNVITVDPNIQNRVEVMYGPGSVMYGSDALGGVMHFYTKDAEFSETDKLLLKTNAFVRYASASQEKSSHVDVNFGLKKWAFLSSITYTDFDDLRSGRRRNPFQDYQWERSVYASRMANKDTALVNSKPEVQKGSGYQQVDLLQKIAFQPNEQTQHILNIQYSNSSNIPRYDRLSEISGGKPSFAEWYYGPQKRLFSTYTFHTTRTTKLYDEVRLILSYQNIEESRYSRRFGNNNRTDRIENLNIYGVNADLMKKLTSKLEWNYGGEFYANDARSTASRINSVTGDKTYATTRYPDGGSQMNFSGVYSRLKWAPSARFLLIPAIRLSNVSLNARTNDPKFSPFFTNVKQNSTALNGQLGSVVTLEKGWRFTSALSTGFRAPNVDDLGKTFESAGGDNLTVPNPDLKPEHTVNAEIGIEKNVANRLRLEVNGFYTWMYDAIRLVPTQFNGQDSVLFEDRKTRVYKNINTAKARIYGFYVGADVVIHRNVSATAAFNYIIGKDISLAIPLDHIPPVFGRISVRGTTTDKRLNGEFFVLYNGWKRLKDYSPSGEDNLQYAIPTAGMPAWYTLNIRGSYQLGRYVQVQAGIENLADIHYRVFASGISAPGRNFTIALRGSF